MSTCYQCGRKGLFLFVDERGICKNCNLQNQNRLISEAAEAKRCAEDFYSSLVSLYRAVKIDTNTCSIDDMQYALSHCDAFASTVEKIPHVQYFDDVLYEHGLSFFSSFAISSDLGELNCTYIGDGKVKLIFTPLFELAESLQKQVFLFLQSKQNFLYAKEHMTPYPIVLTDDATPYIPSSSFSFPLKFSNITKRTSLAKLNTFFVIDVETTGLSFVQHEIVQLSAIKFVGFVPVESFCSYIKPRNGLNLRAAKINGITDTDVEGAPYIEDLISSFDEFLGRDAPIVGHNLVFDVNFLHQNGASFFYYKRNFFDTLELSRREYNLPKNSLDHLCRVVLSLIRSDAHDGLSDSLATGLLFKDICDRRICLDT